MIALEWTNEGRRSLKTTWRRTVLKERENEGRKKGTKPGLRQKTGPDGDGGWSALAGAERYHDEPQMRDLH